MIRSLVLVCWLSLFVAAPAAAQNTHRVERGETLYSLSQRYDVPVDSLRAWNDLEGTTIRVGQSLRLAAPTGDGGEARLPEDAPSEPGSPATVPPEPAPAPVGEIAVRSGSSFYAVARRYGLDADSLFALNERVTAPLPAGYRVQLPRRVRADKVAVDSAATLGAFAKEYGVSVSALRAANRIDVDDSTLAAGDSLYVPAETPAAETTGRETGAVVIFPGGYAGRLMASGETYDPERYVIGHPRLELGTIVYVDVAEQGRGSFAVVADRSLVDDEVVAEISPAVRAALGGITESVRLTVIDRP